MHQNVHQSPAGSTCRAIRIENGLSVQQVADAADVDHHVVEELEHAGTVNVNTAFQIIERGLGVPIAEFSTRVLAT